MHNVFTIRHSTLLASGAQVAVIQSEINELQRRAVRKAHDEPIDKYSDLG